MGLVYVEKYVWHDSYKKVLISAISISKFKIKGHWATLDYCWHIGSVHGTCVPSSRENKISLSSPKHT